MTTYRRRVIREKVLQSLYAYEISKEPLMNIQEQQLGELLHNPSDFEFAKNLIERVVQNEKDLDDSIEGEDVLLVEDIVDTGFTLRYLLQTLAGRAPNSLAVCTFLDRNSRRIVQVPVDFHCFEIPDRFVVGFGLDYNQLYRNLSYVAVMKPEKSA